jgi:hypothetical protein
MGYTRVRLSALSRGGSLPDGKRIRNPSPCLESITNDLVLFSCVKLGSGLVFCAQTSLVPACEVGRHVRRVLVALKFFVHWPSDVIQAGRLVRFLGITTSKSILFPFLLIVPSSRAYHTQCLCRRSKRPA